MLARLMKRLRIAARILLPYRPRSGIVIRLAVLLLCCGPRLAAAQSGELDFRVVPESRIAPVTAAAPQPLPDFRVLGADPLESPEVPALNFTVLGAPDQQPAAQPTVYVYSTDVNRCVPCRKLKADFDAGLIPMQLEWRQPPAWVQAYPTLHWQDVGGNWRQWSGWPGAARFKQIHHNTDIDAQRKK